MPPVVALSGQLVRTLGGASANHETLRLMRAMVNAAKVDPAIVNAAHSLIYLQPQFDEIAEVRAIFDFVRQSVRYVRDVNGVETLCDPAKTLQRMSGDCDDQTMLLCALFESIGYPTRFVMTAYDSDAWQHVYCQVQVVGQWINCDPIEPTASLGFAYPSPRRTYVERV